MNKKINYITSGFVLALCASGLAPAAAQANTLPPEQTNFENIVEKDADNEYKSKITLTDSEGSAVVDIEDAKETIEKALEEYDLDFNNFRTAKDEPIDSDYILKNGENLSLFKSEASGKSETIKLKAPETEKKTDKLFVGETKVESKGEDGEALKTTIVTKNASAKAHSDSEEQKLTILKAPKAKVTLIGTKKKPIEVKVPVVEPVNVERTSTTVSNQQNSPSSSPTISKPARTSTGRVQGVDYSTFKSAPVKRSSTSTVNSNGTGDSLNRNGQAEKDALKSINSSAMVKRVIDQVGKPYSWGATGPSAFDCSGLVYWANSLDGKRVPRTANAQGQASTPVSRANMQPGDILWTSTHIVIYIGDGKIVHASNPRSGVAISDVDRFLANGYKIGRL